MKPDLTSVQTQYLLAIYCWTETHGYPPTVRDLANTFGVSIHAAHGHLISLQKKRMITWDSRSLRTIRLTGRLELLPEAFRPQAHVEGQSRTTADRGPCAT